MSAPDRPQGDDFYDTDPPEAKSPVDPLTQARYYSGDRTSNDRVDDAMMFLQVYAGPKSDGELDAAVTIVCAEIGRLRRANETAGDWLTDEQCDDVIAFLEDYEWTGLTRESVRTWCTAIAEARSSVKAKAEPEGCWACGLAGAGRCPICQAVSCGKCQVCDCPEERPAYP